MILLTGRFAGKKAVIIKCSDEGTKVFIFLKKDRKYGYAVVAGIQKYPSKVSKKLSQKKITKKTNIKPFIKTVNLNHLMPTRYQITTDLDLKTVVTDEKLSTMEKKKELLKELKKTLQDTYRTLPQPKTMQDKISHTRFLYKKLRF